MKLSCSYADNKIIKSTLQSDNQEKNRVYVPILQTTLIQEQAELFWEHCQMNLQNFFF